MLAREEIEKLVEARLQSMLGREPAPTPVRVAAAISAALHAISRVLQGCARAIERGAARISAPTADPEAPALRIRREFAGHLADVIEEELETNGSFDAAWDRASARLGDMEKHVVATQDAHRPVMAEAFLRLAILALCLAIIPRFEFSYSQIILPPALVCVLIFPCLAAQTRPGPAGPFAWRLWQPRLIAAGGLAFALRIMGSPLDMGIAFLLLGLLLCSLHAGTRAALAVERWRAYALAGSIVLMLFGTVVFFCTDDPQFWGGCLFITLLCGLYGIIPGRPSLRWTLAFAATCAADIGLLAFRLRELQSAPPGAFDLISPSDLVWTLAPVPLLGFLFFGRGFWNRELPAAGLLVTIVLQLRMLHDFGYIWTGDVTDRAVLSIIPFCFCLALAVALGAWRKYRSPGPRLHD